MARAKGSALSKQTTVVEESRKEMLQMSENTFPGTQERFDANDRLYEKYGSEILTKAYSMKRVAEPLQQRRQVMVTDRDVHRVEYVDSNLTYCGLDPYDLIVASEDPLDLTEGVTCEACLAAIELEEEQS